MIQSAQFKVQRLRETYVESLRGVDLLNPHPRSGEALDLRLRWRQYQKPDRHQNVSVSLSDTLPAGKAQVIVAAGSSMDAIERHCGDGTPPRTLDQLVPWLNSRASARQRAIYVVRALPTQSYGPRKMLRSAWNERLPSIDLDREAGSCLIVARHDLGTAQGPVVANEVLSFHIQGAY